VAPSARIAECEEGISLIASDVSALVGELARLREDADGLTRLLAERDASLAERAADLARLEEERSRAQEQASSATYALRVAEGRLAELNEHVELLVRESRDLQARLGESECRTTELEEELRRAKDVLAERERALELERAAAGEAAASETGGGAGPASSVDEPPDTVVDDVLETGAEILPASGATAPGEPSTAPGHLRLLWRPDGYRVVASDEPCPREGERVLVDGIELVVARTGPSPLPGDGRRCAFLLPA